MLALDKVQHGIAIAESEEAMRFVRNRKIRLNITPTSNVRLGRVKSMREHPIAKLYRFVVDVTVNSYDILIFDSDVSKKYLRLFNSGCLSVEELDNIRLNGLKKVI